MKLWTAFLLLGGATGLATAFACGGDTPPAKNPDPNASASVAASDAPVASSAAPAASSATPPAKPALKGTIVSFARSATSGTVDKIGDKDGNLKPDGVKDTVFDLEYDEIGRAHV